MNRESHLIVAFSYIYDKIKLQEKEVVMEYTLLPADSYMVVNKTI